MWIGSEGITFLLHSTLPKVSKCYLMQMEKHFLLCKVLGYYPLQTTSNCMEGGRHTPRTQAVVNISALVSSSINYWVTSFKICDINDKDLTSSIDYVPNRHGNGFPLFVSYSMHLSYDLFKKQTPLFSSKCDCVRKHVLYKHYWLILRVFSFCLINSCKQREINSLSFF